MDSENRVSDKPVAIHAVRDDFSQKTSDTLSKRVNGVCSSPTCRVSTRGPHSQADKAVSIGKAAHVTAASPGGPRFDPTLTPTQRKSIENGIWLCSNCATLIDTDESLYTVERLLAWKTEAENRARLALEQPNASIGDVAQELAVSMQLSRARMIERWLAAGVDSALAEDLADDLTIGMSSVFSQTDSPLVVLVGEQGIGKSAVIERRYQASIEQYLGDPTSPIPAFLSARSIIGTLSGALDDALPAALRPQIKSQGVRLFIDGLEEGGFALADTILGQARVMSRAWPNARIVLSSRPGVVQARTEETLEIDRLIDSEAEALMLRVSGLPMRIDEWPAQIRDDLRLPFYAIIAAVLRKESGFTGSPHDAVSEMASKALREASRRVGATAEADVAMRRLASSSLIRGGPILAAEVGTPLQVDALLLSHLVVMRHKRLSFPLALVEQHYAARSLVEGDVKVSNLLDDLNMLDRWRFAIQAAVASGSFDVAADLTQAIAVRHPGFAGGIVRKAIPAETSKSATVPAAAEFARQLHMSQQIWLNSLKNLSSVLPIAEPDGTAPAIGVYRPDRGVLIAQGRRGRLGPKSVVIPVAGAPLVESGDWVVFQDYSNAPEHPSWPLRWALDNAAQHIETLLKQRIFPVATGGAMYRERMWQIARRAARLGSLTDKTTVRTADVQEAIRNNGWHQYERLVIEGVHFSGSDIANILNIDPDQEPTIAAPWYPPDVAKPGGGWVWDFYTSDRLLERTCAVYAGAINAYDEIVETWLPLFATLLGRCIAKPYVLRGWLHRVEADNCPVIDTYLEPISSTAMTRVDIQSGRRDGDTMQLFAELRKVYEQLRLANKAFARIGSQESILEVFDDTPATDLAVEWVIRDLRDIGFLG